MLRLFWFMGTGCRLQGTVGLSYYGSQKTIIIIQNSKFRIQIIEFWILNFEFWILNSKKHPSSLPISIYINFPSKYGHLLVNSKKSCIFALSKRETETLHSSSGPGHQILSLRIEGSNPSCSTKKSDISCRFFCWRSAYSLSNSALFKPDSQNVKNPTPSLTPNQ